MMKFTNKLSIRQFVIISFGLVLLLALLIGAAGRVAFVISKQQNENIQLRSQVNNLTLNLQILTLERIDLMRRFLETDDVRLRLSYQGKQSEYISTYAELAALLRNPTEALALQNVLDAEDEFNNLVEETFALYDEENVAQAQQIWAEEGETLRETIFSQTETWRQVQDENTNIIIEQAQQTERLAVMSVTIFIVLLLLGGILISAFLTRSITYPISKLVEQTKSVDLYMLDQVDPSGPRDIVFLGESINLMTNRLLAARQSVQSHKDQLEQELISASQAQLSFLPATKPQIPGVDLAFYWQPARELAGDFYTYDQPSQDKLGLMLGDVVGKGAPAAMAGSLTMGLMEAYIPHSPEPSDLLNSLNREICTRFDSTHLTVASCYALYHVNERCLTVANAGCIFPFLRRDGQVYEIEAMGLPLGLLPEITYEAQQVDLQCGDFIIFSSDGLVEAKDHNNELFGFDRVTKLIEEIPSTATAQDATSYLVGALNSFTQNTELADDVTLIVLKVT